LVLYLGAEVRCLSKAIHGFSWKKDVKEKTKEIEEALGIPLMSLDDVLRIFLVGDYTQPVGEKETTLNDIERRYAVYDRVKQMREQYPLAHPQALFDFCAKHPEATAKDFEESKEKMQQVFHLFGEKIMRQLKRGERKMPLETSLKDVAEKFMYRDKHRKVEEQLEKRFAEFGLSNFYEQMRESDLLLYSSKFHLEMTHEENEALIAENIMEFLLEGDCMESRGKWLSEAYAYHDARELYARIRFDSAPNSRYIGHDIICKPGEVVG